MGSDEIPSDDPELTGQLDALEALGSDDVGDAEVTVMPGVEYDAAETTLLPVVESDSPVDDGQTMLLPAVEYPVGPEQALQPAVAPFVPTSLSGMSDAEAAALAAASLPSAAESAAPHAAIPLPGNVPPESKIDLGAPAGVDMGPDRPTRWWLWTLIVVLVLGLAGGGVYAWWWTNSRPIRVPDIVGKQAGEAVQIFNDVALRLGDVSEVATDAAPIGTIISQTPEAGTQLKPGARVSFVVALPPTVTKIPDVSGKMSQDAQIELAKARLRPVVVDSFATTTAAGYVVAQLPPVGVELPPGAPVVLVVSKGAVPSTVAVPHVVGLPEVDAGKLLTASVLRPLVYRAYDASIAAGIVMLQSPAAGVAAPYDSPVQVLISQGAVTATVVVPAVTGQSRASAAKELKAKGLKTESRVVSHPTIPKGQVISQMPPAGQKTVSGATVGLLISRGNTAEANVPSLVGTASAGVPVAITNAGFVPVLVNVPVSQYATGTVFMQFPEPGALLTQGLPVICVIASSAP
jgi:serine/threonine-protein kinase